MNPREIQDLIDRIERLEANQAKIEAMQRRMTDQANTVQRVIDAEAEMMRRIRLGPATKEGADAGA